MNEPRATLAAGMEVTPSVRLLSPLGAGGMGAVWLADHAGLKTRVVVKFMLVGLDASATARARFKREAEAASQVKSPHVVQTFDYGVTSEGVPFIVMEYLEGRDLGAEIAARGALDPALVVLVVAQVAKALGKAHGAGLLHRDIKPDNIFLCQSDGEDEIFVKLLDFGIAKAHTLEPEAELDSQTKTGQVVGTPFYMSPEQVTAQKVVDLRSDLWSLGIVAFEGLTGQRPYDGPSFGALAVKIATGEPPRPSEANPSLPPSVDAWFAQACAREPSARFASARELAEKLRAAFDGVVSLPPSGMSDSRPRAQSSSTAIGHADTAVDASLARSEGGASVAIARSSSREDGGRRGGSPRTMKALVLGAALVAITVAIAAGWRARERTSEGRGTTTARGASAVSAGTPASLGTGVAETEPSAAASGSVAPSVAPSGSAVASASVASVDAGARAVSHVGIVPAGSAAGRSGTGTGTGRSGSPGPAGVALDAGPATRPTATTHGDPLY